MKSHRSFPSPLQRVLQLSTFPLDGTESYPPIWAAALGGAALGLLWGGAARLWMRLISKRPEFTLEGTLFILLVSTLFGLWAGLTFVARRRGWRRWGHYVPRALALLFFIPFGFGGGGPLMLTVLLVTLAQTQPTGVAVWALAALVLLLGLPLAGVESSVAWVAGLLVLALTVVLLVRKWSGRWRNQPGARRMDIWIERVARAALLLLALGGFGFVAREVAMDKPGWFAPLYILFYFVLLYSLFLALRFALEPRRSPDEMAPAPAP